MSSSSDSDSSDCEVFLYMYDTVGGHGSKVGVEAIWHTSIVVYGWEYYYGRKGVTRHEPETTCFGEPQRIVSLGETELSRAQVKMFLGQMGFPASKYNLLTNNCNTFTHRFALVIGVEIPRRILKDPAFVY